MSKRNKDRRSADASVPLEHRSGIDRRVHERVLVDIEVDYKADDTFLFAYITDISAMGIFIRTTAPEPEGTRINLRFRLPANLGGDLMELEGEVTWINPPRTDDEQGRSPGMGVQFVDVTAQQREHLMRMVHTFAFLNDEDDEDDETPPKPRGPRGQA